MDTAQHFGKMEPLRFQAETDKLRGLQLEELRPMPKGACIHNTFLEFPDCGGLDSDQEECPFRRQQTDSALVRTYSSRVMLGQEDGRGVHPGRAEKPEPEPVPTEETLLPEADASDSQEGDSPSADSTSTCNSRQVDDRLLAARNLAACGRGLSGMLTVMVRHIPSRYTQQKFMREINSGGFLGKYDFFYVLMQPKSRLNRGFAFINFNTVQDAEEFYAAFHDQRLRHFHMERPLEVMPADLQGFEANVEYYLKMLQATRNKRPLQTGRALFFRQLPGHLAGLAGGVDTADLEPTLAKDRPALPAVRAAFPVAKWFCTTCGARGQPGHAFCTQCGARAPVPPPHQGLPAGALQSSVDSAPSHGLHRRQ
jgi:hypothetical protein